MANAKWDKLKVGDFFTVDIAISKEPLLYQKIEVLNSMLHNTVLLNTGELCNLYIGPETTFEKVEVTFDIKPTE
jgi:hypothetical protein